MNSSLKPFSLSGTVAAASREAFVALETYVGRRPGIAESMPASSLPHYGLKEAERVIAFWWDAGPRLWFAKDPGFDRRFRNAFSRAHEAAASGVLESWLATPEASLALVLLLDQFPRNAFRGTPRMYASDAEGRAAASIAIAAGHDQAFPAELRVFFYLPFAHSEALIDQERAVALVSPLGEPNLSRARHHQDIVRRFGRFPHRNPILGRAMTIEEQCFLDEGGYAG